MKIIIYENQLKKIISEKIRDADAHHDFNSLITVVDGRRGVGFINLFNNEKSNKLKKIIKDNENVRLIKVPNNPYSAYIVYRDGYEEDARELLSIAVKYDGYLSDTATKEDTIRIGQLLGYNDEDILNYVKTKY